MEAYFRIQNKNYEFLFMRFKSKIILYMHFPVNENEIILRFQLSLLFILFINLNFLLNFIEEFQAQDYLP